MADQLDGPMWLVAKSRAILKEQWQGSAGERFRRAIRAIARFDRHNIQTGEHLKALPKVGLFRKLQVYSSQVLNRAADTELKKIQAELALQTTASEIRTPRANADRAELESRKSKLEESLLRIQARKSRVEERLLLTQEKDAMLTLLLKLRDANVVVAESGDGKVMFMPAPGSYERSSLVDGLLESQLTDGMFDTKTVVQPEIGTSISKTKPPTSEHLVK